MRLRPDTIPLSYLNAFEYCPRRFYYEFVQGEMLVNEFVLEGTLLHQRADQPGTTTRPEETQIYRVHLHSDPLGISGFADVVEEHQGIPIPVEYKHGKEGKWINDHIQLCAQALCLEERVALETPLPYGYIFYFGSRKRIQVPFTDELRAKTIKIIEQAYEAAQAECPPVPLEGKNAVRCKDCSLRPLCLPDEVKWLSGKDGVYANPVSH